MTAEFHNFYRNWLTKAQAYNGDNLSDHFDKFVSLYIIYNVLYMQVIDRLIEQEKLISRNFKDKTAATTHVLNFLKPRYYKENLLNDEVSIENLNTIKELIRNHDFNIILSWGAPQRHQDISLGVDLNSNNTNRKLRALLTIFYSVRCNLFHGHKDFNHRQISLLIPTNKLLEKTIIILLYNKLCLAD